MSSKRSPPSSDSSCDSDYEDKRRRIDIDSKLFSGLSIHIIQAKIEATELDLLFSLAESNGAELVTNNEQAEVIVTAISMRRRLERHIKWEIAKEKAVVTPAWITQSVANKRRLACGDYAAVCSLEECTKENCPDHSPKWQSARESSSPVPTTPRNLSYLARFAVQRASPLICPNQGLLEQLAVIHRISNTPRYQTLKEFTRIHGIGPHTARKLYATGCRTVDDLDRYYGAELGRTEEDEPVPEDEISGIRVALELRDKLCVPMPRGEVEEIDRVIAQELEEVEPGCLRTIVGGYRRGKEMSNDVDIVYTHPKKGRERNLSRRLVDRLRSLGLATHVLHITSFRSANPNHAPAGAARPDRPHWDTLDKALIIFRLPATENSPKGLHRRVDLIFAPFETYWTAVVGWTGSTLFERDLRLWAKQKMGMKFDSSGITRRRDTKQFFPRTEAAVFELLGLEYIDPTLRNADI
ncbi:hypothetical protein M422DRAFT_29810 [Sphaerobolus stellatus SS14]|uniref:DNA polymerase n=1 Tax=Sphaerobolus stellatus (strain SS14) TaxID=990650 RepID=A0A0C9W3G4_SPHS4|nr:hypothetical protein M422DRAFT_29810 [Sphaerobolus stellatus SS14]